MRTARRLLLLTAALLLASCDRGAAPQQPLVYFIERDVEGLDPHLSGTLHQTQEVLANLYEGLVGLDESMEVQPALAISWMNPDDRSWVFELREDVRFHDGELLTAADVVFSLQRGRTDPRSSLRATLANVVKVEAEGASRVRITLREPDGFLLPRLREALIVSSHFVARRGEAAFETASAGTGPYMLAARTPGETVDVVRFEGYWGGPAPIPAARFVGRYFGDPGTEALVPAGSPVHYIDRTDGENLNAVRGTAEESRHPSLSIVYLAFDLRDRLPAGVRSPKGAAGNPFRDARVRRAIALSVDYARLLAEGAGGIGLVPTQMVPRFVFGFDPSLPPPRTDREAARKLLAATAFREGFDVDFDVRQMMVPLAGPIVRDLASVGIRARLNALSEPEFFRRARAGESAMLLLRYSCRSGDAQELLDGAIRSQDAARGFGSVNYSYGVCPVPGLDATIDAARQATGPNMRGRLLREALGRNREEALFIPVFHYVTRFFGSPGVVWKNRADSFRLVAEASFRPPAPQAPGRLPRNE